MRLLPFCAVLLVAGCASYSGSNLRPSASTETELRASMGTPAMELKDPDGTRHLYFPRGPLGTQTFIADVGSDGVVRDIRSVLGDGNFNRVQPGLTQDDILRMLGPPRDKSHFERSGQDAWDWKYVDTWGYEAIFSVMFDTNGIVVGKFSKRIERSDGRR